MAGLQQIAVRPLGFGVGVEAFLVEEQDAGAKESNMMAIPVAMPKLVTTSAE
jgi:hypothetical protein